MTKKRLEKKIARRIFKHLIATKKGIMLDENMNIWKNTDWAKVKSFYEIPEKKFDELMKEYIIKDLRFECVTERFYKEIRTLSDKLKKELQIREEEEHMYFSLDKNSFKCLFFLVN